MLVFYSKLSTALLLQRLKSLEVDTKDLKRDAKVQVIKLVLKRRGVQS